MANEQTTKSVMKAEWQDKQGPRIRRTSKVAGPAGPVLHPKPGHSASGQASPERGGDPSMSTDRARQDSGGNQAPADPPARKAVSSARKAALGRLSAEKDRRRVEFAQPGQGARVRRYRNRQQNKRDKI